jgi:hypothetical protein
MNKGIFTWAHAENKFWTFEGNNTGDTSGLLVGVLVGVQYLKK